MMPIPGLSWSLCGTVFPWSPEFPLPRKAAAVWPRDWRGEKRGQAETSPAGRNENFRAEGDFDRSPSQFLPCAGRHLLPRVFEAEAACGDPSVAKRISAKRTLINLLFDRRGVKVPLSRRENLPIEYCHRTDPEKWGEVRFLIARSTSEALVNPFQG
jgi:hypothetical protein